MSLPEPCWIPNVDEFSKFCKQFPFFLAQKFHSSPRVIEFTIYNYEVHILEGVLAIHSPRILLRLTCLMPRPKFLLGTKTHQPEKYLGTLGGSRLPRSKSLSHIWTYRLVPARTLIETHNGRGSSSRLSTSACVRRKHRLKLDDHALVMAHRALVRRWLSGSG